MEKYFEMLGHKAVDKVTGFKGVITSLCFDLYGCIQVILNPGMDKDGKLREQSWFDVNRIQIISREKVMSPPNFELSLENRIKNEKSGADFKPLIKN